MFFQNDEKINTLSRWGCYFCSILAMDEKVTGIKFADKEVFTLWGKNFHEGDIDIESTILNPQGLCNDLKGKLTFKGKFPANYICADNELEILLFHNDATGFDHFVLGDGKNKVIYDPYPNSKTVKYGKIVGKRIFIKGLIK